MELLKTLKAKSIRRTILPVCVLLIAAVLCAVVSKPQLLFSKPVNLYDVPREALEGKYVTVRVERIYDSYAYTEQFKDNVSTGISSQEYIIDANEMDYCGLLLKKDMLEQADALLDSTYDYLMGEAETIEGGFTVTGVMRKMPEDSLDFYHEVVDYDSMPEENQEYFLPLYLVPRTQGDVITSWVFLGLGLVFLAIAVVQLCKAGGGKNQKQILRKAEELSPGNPDYILTHADELYKTAPSVGGLRMNASLILVEQGARQFLYGTKDLVWAYQNTVQHRTNGIPTGKSYHLMLNMADGTTRDLQMKETQVKEQLQKIFALVPACALGYDKDLQAMFRNNRGALAEVARAQHAPKEEPAVEEAAPAEKAEAPAEDPVQPQA